MNNSWIKRKKTNHIFVGDVGVGGDHPISIQSMTNTNTADVEATVNQIDQLQAAGADIVRVSVPDSDCAKAFKKIKQSVSLPLVADIHFDYKIALLVADSADCLRINPGNIGKENKVKEIISRYEALEKTLSKSDIDKNTYVKNSKEYASIGDIIDDAKLYVKIVNDQKSKGRTIA